MMLTSSAFEHEGFIPPHYTCDGDDVHVPLMWSDVPNGAKSFVLFMEDLDVAEEIREDATWDHWIVFNIPSSVRSIDEEGIPDGSELGTGTAGEVGYEGPCPAGVPGEEHRYVFTLYALDTVLDVPPGAKKNVIMDAMEGHIIDSASLLGRYQRESGIRDWSTGDVR